MEAITDEVKQVGGSLMVRIPKKYADEHGIRAGDNITFEPRKEKLSMFGLWADKPYKPWNKEEDGAYFKFDRS